MDAPQGTEGAETLAPRTFPVVHREPVAKRGATLRDADFTNRSLYEANGAGAFFDTCDFSYSVIERSYFRNAHFKSCKFVGAKIIWSNFRGCKFDNCDFKYALIDRSLVDREAILASLPHAPNWRREWLQQLRMNAQSLGRAKDASGTRGVRNPIIPLDWCCPCVLGHLAMDLARNTHER